MKVSLFFIITLSFFSSQSLEKEEQVDTNDTLENKENTEQSTASNLVQNSSEGVLVQVRFLEPKGEGILLNDLNPQQQNPQRNDESQNAYQTSQIESSAVVTQPVQTGYSSITATNTYIVPTESPVAPNTTCIVNSPETTYAPTPITQPPVTPTTVPCEQPGSYQPQPSTNNTIPENIPKLDCTKIAVLNAGEKSITQYLCFQYSV